MAATPGLGVLFTACFLVGCWGSDKVIVHQKTFDQLSVDRSHENHLRNSPSSDGASMISSRVKRSPGEYCANERGISVGLVIDTTGSMATEIREVINYAINILNELTSAPNSPVCDLVFVPTHDEIPTYENYVKTRNLSILTEAVKNIEADGGRDCPEKTLVGIEKAVDLSTRGSYIFVFTDADPNDDYLYSTVAKKMQEKQITIFFLLTGDCDSEKPESFVKLTKLGGMSALIYIDKSSKGIQDFLAAIKSTFLENTKIIQSVSGPPTTGDGEKIPVAVPPDTPSLRVTGSGDNVQVELKAPDGSTPEKINKLYDISTFKILSVSDPAPGVWSINLKSDSPFKVVATGVSDVDIGFGFSSVPTNDMMSVAKRPGADTVTYLLMRVSDTKKVLNISRVDVIVDSAVVQSLLVECVDKEGGVYRAKSTTYPNKSFKIRMNAFTSDGYLLTRESQSTIEPEEPGPPAIECREWMQASAGSPFNLTCIVESHTEVEVKMQKEGSTHTHIERHPVTTRIAISFAVLRKNDAGYYLVEAKNRAGNVTKKIHLDVLENPPKAFIDTPLFGVVGNNKTINCRCDSFTDCTLEWTKSDSPANDFLQKPAVPLLSEGNVKVGEVKVMLSPVTEKDGGWYICTGRNGGGTDVAKTYLEIRERPEVEIYGASETPVTLVNFTTWNAVSITCRVKKGRPLPHLNWLKDNRKILDSKSATTRGENYVTHTIKNAEKYMEGDYFCRGDNFVGVDEKKVTLQFLQAPKIIRSTTYSPVVLVGANATLVCYFVGTPTPIVRWTRKINDSIMPIETREGSFTTQDSGQASLTLYNVRLEDTGTYYCEASNVVGSKKTQMNVSAEEKPYFKIKTDEVTVQLDGKIELPCKPTGIPKPRVSWWKVGGDLPGKIVRNNYQITNAAFEEQGVYVCRAENDHGADEYRVRVHISGTAPPKIVKEFKSDTVTRKSVSPGGAATLDCSIFQGNPVPTLSWVHNGKTVRNERPFSILQEYSSLTIKPVTEDETGNYTCVAENQVGKDQKTFVLKLYKPPRIIEPPSVIEVKSGVRVFLNCTAEGNPTPTVAWFVLHKKVETPIPPTAIGSSQLEVPPNKKKKRSKYLCRAINEVGKAEEIFQVNILNPPVILVRWEEKMTKKGNEVVTLNCTVKGYPKPSITWTHDGNTVSTVGNNPILSLAHGEAGTYRCTANNDVGAASQFTVIDRLEPPEIDEFSPVTQVAVYGSVVLKCTVHGNPVPSISWDFNGNTIVGQKQPELEIPSVSKSMEGKYTCFARNSEGFDQKATRLAVMDKPLINCLQRSYEVIAGKIVSFLCQTEANPKAEIKWYKDGRLWSSSSDDGSFQFVAGAKDAGHYTVEASNKFGSDSKTIELTVLRSPSFSPSHPKEINVTTGSNAVLPCQADGFPQPKIIWDVLTLPAPLNKVKYLSSSSLEILDVQRDYEGDYKCTAVNKAGSQIHFVHLNVLEKPRIKIVSKNVPKSGDVNSGDEVVLTCEVHGKPAPELFWFKDELPLSSDRVIKFTASESKSGSYTCQAKNAIGEASDSISVNALSLPAFRDPSYELVTGIEGQTLHLLCSAYGNPPPTISWYKNDQKLANSSETIVIGPTLQILKVSKTSSGNITCKAANVRETVKKMFGIRVDIRPKIVRKPPYEIPVYFNTGFSVPCKAEGSPKPLIEWTIETAGRSRSISPGINDDGVSVLPDGTLLAKNVTWKDVRIFSCIASNTAGSDRSYYALPVSELPNAERAIDGLLDRSPSAKVIKVRRGKREILECPSITVYRWLKNFNNIPWEDMSGYRPRYSLLDGRRKLSVNDPSEGDTATYTCINSRGERNDFILNVVSEPHFLSRPDEEERYLVAENEPLEINCEATGNPKPLIFWFVQNETFDWIPMNNYTMEGVTFLGDQNQHLRINSAITSHSGSYKCVALNQDGSQSRKFSIAVAAIPKLKGDKEVIVDVAVGQPLELKCEIEGGSDALYEWFITKDIRTRRLAVEDRVLIISPSRLEDRGFYRCIGRSRLGSAQQDFNVNVVVPPRLKGESTSTVKFFLGDTVELECLPEESVTIVNWSKGEEKILRTERIFPSVVGFGDVLSILNASEADSGKYECSVYNMAGAARKIYFLRFIDVIPNSKMMVNFTLGDPLRLPCPLTFGDQPIVWKKDGSVIQRLSLRGQDFYKYESSRGDEVSPKMLKTRTERAIDLEVGQELVLECAAEGVPTPAFYWTKNDAEITDGSDSFYTSSSDGSYSLMKYSVSNDDGGRYVCHAWSESGESAAFYDVIIVGNPKEHPNGGVSKIKVQLDRPLTIVCPFIDVSDREAVWKKGGYVLTNTDMMYLGFSSSFADGYAILQTGQAGPRHGDIYVCIEKSDTSAKTHTFVVSVTLPMYYKDWTEWSDCSATCGGGTKKRERVCEPSTDFQPEDIVTLVHSTCMGPNEQNKSCNQSPCSVDGEWGEWREWGPCSHSCDGGVRKRIRLCDNPPPSSGGKVCQGNSQQESSCGDAPCPVDGGWGEWTKWTDCSTSCGTGIMYRYRQCDRPRTAHGGRPCAGFPHEQRLCSSPCDKSGKRIKEQRNEGKTGKPKWIWSEWGEFGACTSGCDSTRIRFQTGTCEGSTCKERRHKTRKQIEPCPRPPGCR